MRSISGPWSMVGARLPAVWLCVALGSASPGGATQRSRALADTVATLFDSLSAIHTGRPDTGLLRRLHPPADTIHFVEGTGIESFTGDSLFRRVMVAHRPVSAMTQRFDDRTVHLLAPEHAVATARESVDWTDTSGTHQYRGMLTIVASRRGGRWVIRSYHGS